MAERSGDAFREVELLTVGESEELALLLGSVGEVDGLGGGRALDETSCAAHQVVAHEATPVVSMFGASEREEGVNFAVHLVAKSGFGRECR